MFCYVWIFHQQVSQKVRNWNHTLSIQWMNNGWTIGTRNVNVLGLLNWPPLRPLKVDVNPIFFNMHPSALPLNPAKTRNQTQLDCFGRQSTTRTHHIPPSIKLSWTYFSPCNIHDSQIISKIVTILFYHVDRFSMIIPISSKVYSQIIPNMIFIIVISMTLSSYLHTISTRISIRFPFLFPYDQDILIWFP